jgi:hypothetical protein
MLALGLGWLAAASAAEAGLSLEIHLYRDYQGVNYAFYTPLTTNSAGATPALGTYIVMSPQAPTNGCTRSFEMTAACWITTTWGSMRNCSRRTSTRRFKR